MSDDEGAFDEETVATGGIRTLDDYVAACRLLQAGKNDEVLFTFRISEEGLKREIQKWEDSLRDPEVAAQFKQKMSGS